MSIAIVTDSKNRKWKRSISKALKQRGDAPKPRKPRADKGVPRGPRALKGTKAYQIGHLSLLRFRHGRERQVSQRTLDAVREAQGAGVEPWNTAEHDKAVHGPTPEGGTTNPMESEPPVSETYEDEGDDERDENAPADDEMAFIDDAFFELPDVATEGEAEGGGARVSTASRVRGARARGARAARAANGRPGRANGTEEPHDASWNDSVSNSYKEAAAGTDTDTRKTPTTATKMERGARTKRCPTAQQSQDRASNHPKRAIQTKAARQRTNLQ